MTPAEVAAYQKVHLNHLGEPLRVDGDLGPQTQWTLDLGTLCAERRNFVRELQSWRGLVEVPAGSNDDPTHIIRGWLTHCGAKPGDPWCASYLSHCISEGGVAVAIAGALALGRHFPETFMPVAGDIFTYPTGGGKGHCGGIGGCRGGGSVLELMTYEGNCANAMRCVLRERRLHSGMRFWRVFPDASGTCPGIPPKVPPAPGGVV